MVYVYGGSFNPPTIAHKRIISKLLQQKDAKVIIVPVGNDYQKAALIDANHRLHMLERMVQSMDRVSISTLEIKHPYAGTKATLDELSKTYDQLCYVMGADQLASIHTWIDYRQLLSTYPFMIMMRDQMTVEHAESYVKHLKHHFEYVTFHEPYSSSDVRQKKAGYELSLDPNVYEYIKKNNLYED